MNVTTFTAGPQALGYLYQARVALFLLLQCPDEAQVRIEALDDVEVLDPSAAKQLQLSQLKHHIKKAAALTNSSPDLWKSIRVWAEQVLTKSFHLTDTRFYLLTTASAAHGSAAAMLLTKDRDPKQATKELLKIAKTSDNVSLKPAFDAFLALSEAQRDALVESITILDQHDDIEGYRKKICQRIRPAVRKARVEALYERVEGWWFNQIVMHLLKASDTPFITAFALNEKVASLAESLHDESLPIDFLDHEPTPDFFKNSENKLYVKQLAAINVTPTIISKAILDYYRAFQQRSRWLEEGLVSPEELASYERVLVDEWERYFAHACGTIPKTATEDDLIAIGKEVFNWAEFKTMHLKIRPRVEADFVRRGSFHHLADKEPKPSLHWHPKFLEKMDSLISKAAKIP